MRHLLLTALVLAVPSAAAAQTTCPAGATCVPKEDMQAFVQLLRDQKCRNETKPSFQLDPINIVVDEEGRVFYSGAEPHPYTLKMTWCNYQVTAEGQVKLVVAKREPPVWGFRFRPKFQSGFLFVDAFHRDSALSAVDVGVLFEGVYWRSVNLNVALGFRSVGAGVGFDITKNFGGYVGYAVSYDGWRSNPYAGLSFAFW